MALPNSNISVSMVKAAIGSGSNDVGTLCTHPNINKWSKWKPVRFNKVTGLTEGDLVTANFGLVITPESISYVRPRGGSVAEPYRIGDFRNYNHTVFPQYFIEDKDYEINYFIDSTMRIPIRYISNLYTIPFNQVQIEGVAGVTLADCSIRTIVSHLDGTIIHNHVSGRLSESNEISIDSAFVPVGEYVLKFNLTYRIPNTQTYINLPYMVSPNTPDEVNLKAVYWESYMLEILSMEVRSGSTWIHLPRNQRTVISNAELVNRTRITLRYTSIEVHTQRMDFFKLVNSTNPLFMSENVSDSEITIISQSGVSGSYPYFDFVDGGIMEFSLENDILQLNDGQPPYPPDWGPTYPEDYPVYYNILYDSPLTPRNVDSGYTVWSNV